MRVGMIERVDVGRIRVRTARVRVECARHAAVFEIIEAEAMHRFAHSHTLLRDAHVVSQ